MAKTSCRGGRRRELSAETTCGWCINSDHAELAGVLDTNPARAADAAAAYGCPVFRSLEELAAKGGRRHRRDAHHHPCRNRLPPDGTRAGCDGRKTHRPHARRRRALWSRPPSGTEKSCKSGIWSDSIPPSSRWNRSSPRPLFFEVHRLSEFSPRSLDVDVVLDLMIHDLDIVLSLTGKKPEEIRAAGISILVVQSGYRQCPDAVSRRMRRQPHCQPGFHRTRPQTAPVSAARVYFARLQPPGRRPFPRQASNGNRFYGLFRWSRTNRCGWNSKALSTPSRTRQAPRVTGAQALAALEVALDILDKIEEHSALVAQA